MKAMVLGAKEKGAIKAAVSVLRKGGVIIYPSESSYGIGADATNGKAVRKISRIKGRGSKPISIIVSSIAMARKYAYVDKETVLVAKKFMPGRLTLVSKKKGTLPGALSKDTIGFRIPPHELSLKLVEALGKPVTATSANRAGKPALYNIKDVVKEFGNSVVLIIDGGNLPKRKASTVFDAVNGRVIRKGPVKEKDIVKCLKA